MTNNRNSALFVAFICLLAIVFVVAFTFHMQHSIQQRQLMDKAAAAACAGHGDVLSRSGGQVMCADATLFTLNEEGAVIP